MEKYSGGENSLEERLETLENLKLAQDVKMEREKSTGMTDEELEKAADVFLRANGFGDLT